MASLTVDCVIHSRWLRVQIWLLALLYRLARPRRLRWTFHIVLIERRSRPGLLVMAARLRRGPVPAGESGTEIVIESVCG